MADIRINALATTAASTASDDFIAVDGSANGTRKLNAYSPTFGGNLTVSGTGTSTFSGVVGVQSTAASFGSGVGQIYVREGATPTKRLFMGYDTTLDGGYIVSEQTGVANKSLYIQPGGGGTVMGGNLTVSGTGNSSVAGTLLVATTTNSSNGKIQLADHTTSAGGIGFGTDVSLFRSAAGVLRLASTSNYSHEIVNTGGTGAATTSYSNTGGYLFVGIDSSSGGALGGGAYAGVIARDGAYSLILRTNSTTALTLDSSQNATFAGDRVINRKDQNAVTRLQVRNDTSGTSGQAQISATVGDFTTYTALGQLSAGFTSTGLYQANSGYLVGSNALYIFTASGSSLVLGTNNTTALTLDSSQNATFAGNIKTAAPSGGTAATWRLGTVATVSPTSPNRTIEVEIGGTTYYIHAKTTNN